MYQLGPHYVKYNRGQACELLAPGRYLDWPSWPAVARDGQAMVLSIAKDVRGKSWRSLSGGYVFRQAAEELAEWGEITGRMPFRRLDTFG